MTARLSRLKPHTLTITLTVAGITLLSSPALAQPTGSSFCTTALAETIKNLFSVIQFGGPLIGGVVALGSAVGLSFVRSADHRHELKQLRNRGVIWGVIVAPLGTVIVQFILNTVVAGGASCTF